MTCNTELNHQIWQTCEQTYQAHPHRYLELQEAYKINVNLLLLAEQLDKQSIQFTPVRWQQLAKEIEQWEQAIVQPYRQLRKLAKASLHQPEYQQMLDVELMLERKSQRLILHKLKQLPVNEAGCLAASTHGNVEAYLSHCHVPMASIRKWSSH